jgi:branched-chain amino acid transport system substrate-binding protein
MSKKRVIMLAIVLILFVAVNCASAQKRTLPPIKIGCLTSLSGPFVVWGDPIAKGMRFAVEELNEAGGVLGRKVVLAERDTKGSPAEALTSLKGLVERERVVAAGGIVSSGVGMACASEAEVMRIPLLLGFAGSPAILSKGSRYTFRTNLVAAPMLIDCYGPFIEARGFKRVGVISADYAWGHAINAAIKEKMVPLPNMRVQIEVAPVPEKDFTTYLRRLEPLKSEILILTGHPPGEYVAAKQAFEMGTAPYATFSGGGEEVFMDRIGKLGFNRVIDFASADFEAPAYQDLADRYYRAFGALFGSSAFSGYVSVKMVADAIAQTKSDDPKVITDFVHKGRFIQPGYAFPLSYTEWGELKEASYVLFTLEEGDPGRINPGAGWRPKVLFRSPRLEPHVPEK